ncbi:MAG: hypothetical protein C7B46_13780 [Sulfobacillus benefaciens]|uniref:Uncharacterized protein n=1 Tax=Sulfobacillus benefaciens TaxID=453960 RepID=A0A2T2XDQ4_9FIRM|nr:MAG: hypothetical protein C7B46_13780 [Sulfobacillus benefaciens]
MQDRWSRIIASDWRGLLNDSAKAIGNQGLFNVTKEGGSYGTHVSIENTSYPQTGLSQAGLWREPRHMSVSPSNLPGIDRVIMTTDLFATVAHEAHHKLFHTHGGIIP